MGDGKNGEEYDVGLLLELAAKECRFSGCGLVIICDDVEDVESSCIDFRGAGNGEDGSRDGSFIDFSERFAEKEAD